MEGADLTAEFPIKASGSFLGTKLIRSTARKPEHRDYHDERAHPGQKPVHRALILFPLLRDISRILGRGSTLGALRTGRFSACPLGCAPPPAPGVLPRLRPAEEMLFGETMEPEAGVVRRDRSRHGLRLELKEGDAERYRIA